MHGEIRHIRNLNHKPEHINEIINILFPLHRIQQFAIWFCWSVFFLCSSSMFWSTSYNYHRTLNESSSIWLVFTSTLECIELLESSNKPFIIERIHFHRKLFRSFFFTFFVDSYFGCFFRFLCRLKPPSSIHGIWNVVSDTEEFRWIRWIDGDDRDRKKNSNSNHWYLIWNAMPSIYLYTWWFEWLNRATFLISIQYLINLPPAK